MMRTAQIAVMAFLVSGLILLAGCSITRTIAYPPSDELFVTMGDDPGSESNKVYVPKGNIIHFSTESYIPLPVLGLMTLGNADPQYVFEHKIVPEVTKMGGDAITNARVDFVPPPGFLARLLGLPLILMEPSRTVVTGQVVKR
ncbi:MAG: hypothetical protein ABIK28_11940 [Planctomycetota bacterium]